MSKNNADIVTMPPKPSEFNPTYPTNQDETNQQKNNGALNECCDETCNKCCDMCLDLLQFWFCLRFWGHLFAGTNDSSNSCCSCCEGSDGCCESSCDGCCGGDASCCDGCCDGCFE